MDEKPGGVMFAIVVRACRPARLLGVVVVAVLASVAPASGHFTGSTPLSGTTAAGAGGPFPGTTRDTGDQIVPGPCTARSAADQYRSGEGHDHVGMPLHEAACAIQQSAFLPLDDVLDDEILGEMDAEAGIAAVAISYPQAGVLFFDVSDPAKPEFLSKYESSECEGLAIDVDCGAYVDVSPDGKAAYLALQQISVLPGRVPDSDAPLPAQPGVEVIDISDPRNPERTDFAFIGETAGGSHATRSHVIPEGFSPDAVPGEYLFSMDNSGGIVIHRVEKAQDGSRSLEQVNRIPTDEIHDSFIANDPIDQRVYLYLASGLDTGFLVWDVTDPTAAEIPLVAEWDLTPQCEQDWYSHTIDVTYRGDRRYVTLPAELFTISGEQSDEDRAEGCGEIVGNGDKVGPLWIVDASDFSKLGPADAEDTNAQEAQTDDELRANSAAALVATWTNAASREGGNLLFSPHNQQIVGDKIYLSGYHSGVTVLDASEAFAGKRGARPSELAFVVPSGTPTRPFYDQLVGPAIPFVETFSKARPIVWDQIFYIPPGASPDAGRILAADMTGGFYSYREVPEPPPPPAPATGRSDSSGGQADAPPPRNVRRLSLSYPRRPLRRGLRRGIRVAAWCRERCRLEARLIASARTARRHGLSGRIVGRGRPSRPVDGRVAMRVRFTREARRELRDARALRLKLVLTAREVDSGRVTRLRRVVYMRR